jgi:hypothetical protein
LGGGADEVGAGAFEDAVSIIGVIWEGTDMLIDPVVAVEELWVWIIFNMIDTRLV